MEEQNNLENVNPNSEALQHYGVYIAVLIVVAVIAGFLFYKSTGDSAKVESVPQEPGPVALPSANPLQNANPLENTYQNPFE